MTLAQIGLERLIKTPVLFAGRDELIRFDQRLPILRSRTFCSKQLLHHLQASLFSGEIIHDLKLAAQPVLQREHSQHAIEKSIDRPQRQLRHAVQQSS